MQVFVLPSHGAVVVGDDEMLETFPVSIRVVEDAVTGTTIATCSTHFLGVIL